MSIYYVYQYLRSDGTPYYIGKGRGNRVHSKDHNVHRPKDKSRIIMIEENMLETDALDLEIKLIAKYGRKDIGTGILRNMTNGGEGSSGYVPTPETRAKNSAARKKYYEDPENRAKQSAAIKKHYENPENRAKQSAAMKKRYEDPEAREKMSVSMKKRYEDPEARKKTSAAIKISMNTPESRERKSSASKLAWIKRKEKKLQIQENRP